MVRIAAIGQNKDEGKRNFLSRLVEDKEYTMNEMAEILFKDFPFINQFYIKKVWIVREPVIASMLE